MLLSERAEVQTVGIINEGRFLSKELTWRFSEDFPCSFSESGNAFGV